MELIQVRIEEKDLQGENWTELGNWEAFRAISEDKCGEIVEENMGNIEECNERVVEVNADSWKDNSIN